MAIQTAPLHSAGDDVATASGVGAATSVGASETTVLVLEAALTHSRLTEVVDATGLARA